MWLGDRRGNLIDWLTQKWVQATGRGIDLRAAPWLDGPVGSTTGIGPMFFESWAASKQLRATRHVAGRGLLPFFADLAGPDFDPTAVHPDVAAFYERTADFDIDVRTEWNGPFLPFGALVVALFSRRLDQLNLPLGARDANWGMASAVIEVVDPATAQVRANAWVRTFARSGRTVYAGSYSVATPPGAAGPCVKTVFPLPNGNAVVFLRPMAQTDGSLVLLSEGERFGDPGFYFTVHRPDGRVTARYLRCFRERIRVFPAPGSEVKAEHEMSLWGFTCVRLRYRLRQRSAPIDPRLA